AHDGRGAAPARVVEHLARARTLALEYAGQERLDLVDRGGVHPGRGTRGLFLVEGVDGGDGELVAGDRVPHADRAEVVLHPGELAGVPGRVVVAVAAHVAIAEEVAEDVGGGQAGRQGGAAAGRKLGARRSGGGRGRRSGGGRGRRRRLDDELGPVRRCLPAGVGDGGAGRADQGQVHRSVAGHQGGDVDRRPRAGRQRSR